MKCSFGIQIGSLLVLSTALSAFGDEWPQWRGPQRNGISQETGLLKEWPKDGPKLHWKVADAGKGYSTPAVVGDRLYLLGNEGLENELDRKSTRLNSSHLGISYAVFCLKK